MKNLEKLCADLEKREEIETEAFAELCRMFLGDTADRGVGKRLW